MRHKHNLQLVAVDTTSFNSWTFLLYRCSCGKVRTKELRGEWTLAELGVIVIEHDAVVDTLSTT